MIRTIGEWPSGLPDRNFALVRMESTMQAYGPHCSFLSTLVQTTPVGEVVAVLQRLDDTLTLWTSDEAEPDELLSFFKMSGCSRLLCEAGAGDRLNLPLLSRQRLLCFGGGEISFKEICRPIPEIIKEPSLYTACRLFYACGFEDLAPFESFYPDVSHRIRHRTARCRMLADCSAVILSGYETASAAVVAGVSALPEYRRTGRGSLLLNSLTRELTQEGRQVYLCREEEKNREFYHACGFEETGWWNAYRLNG